MSTKYRKLRYPISYVILTMLLCLAAGIGVTIGYQRMTACYNNRSPLISMDVTIDVSQQKQLIEQFQKFAHKNGFQFHLVTYTPNGQEFLIKLSRKDTELIGSNTSFDLSKFYVDFYNNNCIHPTVVSDISSLISELNDFISQIPSVTITDGK